MLNRTRPAIERVLPRLIVAPTGCHIWPGAKDGGGYGMVRDGKHHRKVHRVVYEAANGQFPRELDVLHRCDVPACCNPLHLFLGTDRDNQQDRIKKGRGMTSPADINRHKTHCKHGHEFTEENTYRYGGGKRACKACRRARKPKRDPLKQRDYERRRTERRRIERAAARAARN